jgi:hypothetical protein
MTCSTCRNFRKGVVAHVGFCALDRAREPLTGDEIRACWQPPVQVEPPTGLFAMVEALDASAPDAASLTPGRLRAPTAAIATTASAYRPTSWIPVEPRVPDRPLLPVTAPPPGALRSASVPVHRTERLSIPTQAPETRPVGRLLEAPTVVPALRLGSRGDARAMREAAAAQMGASPPPQAAPMPEAAPSTGPERLFDGEGLGLLDGGTAR